MTNNIKTMDTAELDLIAGGVTEGPNGEGCTDSMVPPLKINGLNLGGGPLHVGDIFGSND